MKERIRALTVGGGGWMHIAEALLCKLRNVVPVMHRHCAKQSGYA